MDRRNRLAGIARALGAVLMLSGAVRAGVPDAINAIVRDPYLKNVDVGIKIVRLGDKPDSTIPVFERQAESRLIPASNLKVITTAAALDGLGADFHFRTILVQKGHTLAIVGDGDPTLGDAELYRLRKIDWKSTTLFQTWAEALAKRGIVKADGLAYDDSIFDQQFQHPNWPGDQIHKRYVAGVAGLNFNANCLDFYLRPRGMGAVVDYLIEPQITGIPINNNCVLGSKNAVWLSRAAGSSEIELKGQTNAANIEPISVTVNDPSYFTALALSSAFGQHGVPIEGQLRHDATIRSSLKDWTLLAVHETPLKEVLARANKDSMNLYAEALCKRLGAKVSNQPGSWANGTAATGKYLESLGIPADQFNLDDGCGLSRKNTVSPSAIVTVLQHQFYGKNRDAYLASLAVAGVDGTLENRFPDGNLRERVFAKSGFIDGVSALSGFVKSRDGSWYAFSILFNGIGKGTNGMAKKFQERIVSSVDP